MSADSRAPVDEPLAVYTIGHSNHDFATFLGLLQRHGVEVLVDVRSAPYARYTPHFDKRALANALSDGQPSYLFLGREWGGRPEDAAYYTRDQRVRYRLLAQSPRFHQGLRRVLAGCRRYRLALMCSEEDPADCHRHKMIAQVLLADGVVVHHIRGDGSLQSAAELLAAQRAAQAERRRKGGGDQLALFPPDEQPAPDEEEDELWLSTRSVSPGRPPPTSSTP